MAGMNPRLTSETRERLKAGFLACYAKKPWQEIGVAEIADAAGYARGTFYRHFTSVEDILHQVEAENTCTGVCRRIVENVADIPLEDATDAIVSFYEDRADAVAVLAAGNHAPHYLDAQRLPMKAVFAALLKRGFVMHPLQLELISEYLASARIGMIRLWLQERETVSLGQINKMAESLIESEMVNFLAQQAPAHGGPQPRKVIEDKPFDYPWLSGK